MREYKFRGRRLGDGGWCFGYLVSKVSRGKTTWWIVDNLTGSGYNGLEVSSATVGQFTGLHDKNGLEIYDGDILREPPKNEYEKENYTAYEVFWHDNDCASHHIGWQMNRCHFQGCICGTMYIPEFLPKTTARMEIIGNIHDNNNLLEKGGRE